MRRREDEPVGGGFMVEGDWDAVRREAADGARGGGRVLARTLTGIQSEALWGTDQEEFTLDADIGWPGAAKARARD